MDSDHSYALHFYYRFDKHQINVLTRFELVFALHAIMLLLYLIFILQLEQ